MTTAEVLTQFWEKNNFGKDGGIQKDWNQFEVKNLSFSFPNLHKQGYLLHDVNHLLCEYKTDWIGEFETAAWELASGGRKGFGLSWFYPIVGFVLGLVCAPKRTFTAYKKGQSKINAHILSKNHDVLSLDFKELKRLSNNQI